MVIDTIQNKMSEEDFYAALAGILYPCAVLGPAIEEAYAKADAQEELAEGVKNEA